MKTNFDIVRYAELLGCLDTISLEELIMAVRRQSQVRPSQDSAASVYLHMLVGALCLPRGHAPNSMGYNAQHACGFQGRGIDSMLARARVCLIPPSTLLATCAGRQATVQGIVAAMHTRVESHFSTACCVYTCIGCT